MKLQENYYITTPTFGKEIKSPQLVEIVADAARQIAELEKNRKVEILDFPDKGIVEFSVYGCNKSEYPISWRIKLNMHNIVQYLRSIDCAGTYDTLIDFFESNKWDQTEDYLNQCDFETLTYL